MSSHFSASPSHFASDLLTLLRRRYPDFRDFCDPDFTRDEIEAKHASVLQARELLSAGELEQLIQDARFPEFLRRLEIVGNDSSLLWRKVPSQGDLAILNQPDLPRETFCLALFDLLHGQGESPARLERYVNYVRAHRLPNKWTFPTFFLWLLHPQTDWFVQPTLARWLLEFAGETEAWTHAPTPECYAVLLKLARQIKDTLHALEPHDNVDVQSLVRVAQACAKREDYAFAPRAFKLISQPDAPRLERKQWLETPFERLTNAIEDALPDVLDERLTRLTSKRRKRDETFLRAAWSLKEHPGAQLVLLLQPDGLEFGFAIEASARENWKLFAANRRASPELPSLLRGTLSEAALTGANEAAPSSRLLQRLDRAAVLRAPLERLASQVARAYEELFPLVLLATSTEPLEEIRAYRHRIAPSRPYTLAD